MASNYVNRIFKIVFRKQRCRVGAANQTDYVKIYARKCRKRTVSF